MIYTSNDFRDCEILTNDNQILHGFIEDNGVAELLLPESNITYLSNNKSNIWLNIDYNSNQNDNPKILSKVLVLKTRYILEFKHFNTTKTNLAAYNLSCIYRLPKEIEAQFKLLKSKQNQNQLEALVLQSKKLV